LKFSENFENIHQNIDFFSNTHAGSKPGFELAPKLILRENETSI